VYPYAAYAALLEVLPFPKYALEGRLQRQLVLYEHKVRLPDPMLVFEEITRFRLLKGILSLDQLYHAGELDALAAAYTAWMAANHAEQVSLLGDAQEGQIVLPVAKLKPRY
jgi:predicted RNase H-like nuclease